MHRYEPDDAWPKHPKPYWRDTLQYAQDHRWTFTDEGHFGAIKCPTGVCMVRVYSTGRGGESVARQTRRKIERCPHGQGTPDLLATISKSLDRAARFLDAAAALLDQRDAEQAIEMLDAVGELLDDAVWDEIGGRFTELDVSRDSADAAFHDLAVEPMPASDALGAADGQIKQARKDLKDAKRSSRERVREYKTRAAELQARLGDLRSRAGSSGSG